MKNTKVEQNKELLKVLHDSKSKTIIDSKTAKALKQDKSKKRDTKALTIKKVSRQLDVYTDVNTVKDSVHKAYLQRDYHFQLDDDNVNTTTRFYDAIAKCDKALTNEIALSQLISYLKSNSSLTYFNASQLIREHRSRGASYGDMYRNAFRSLTAQKILKLDESYRDETKRLRFTVVDSAKLATLK